MSKVLVMVGTRKGAFFFWSDERRESWRLEGPLLRGWEVLDIELDPRSGRPILYAAVGHFIWGPTLHMSRDLGRTWSQIEHGPRYQEGSGRALNRIWCIARGHPSEPDVLFAGVDEAGLFVTRDGGDHWHEIESLSRHPTRAAWCPGLGGMCCHTILVDPRDKDRMWVGISVAGVFRTDDGGESWVVKNRGLPLTQPARDRDDVASCVHHMVLSPDAPDVIYQQHHQGVFRSTDGADTWHRIQDGLPSEFGLPMAMHSRDSKTLYVLPVESFEYRLPIDGRLVVYRSRDGGDNWQPMTAGLPASHFYAGVLRQAMATDDLADCGVYFGTTAGQVFYSRDGGESWRTMPGYGALPRVLSVKAAVID